MSESNTETERSPRKGDLIMPAEREGFQGPLIKKRKIAPIKKVGAFGYCVLLILTLAAFSPLLQNGTLWSSYDEVSRSVHLGMNDWTDAWSIENIRKHDPITLSSYFWEDALPLPPALAHHGINLLLHLTAALLLLRFLQLLELPGALVTTMAFALHPTVVQTLFWSGYREEIIGLIIILVSLHFGVRNKSSRDYLISLALTALACLMHSAAFAIPVILALSILFQHRRFKIEDFNRVLPVLCICLFIGVWTAAAPVAEANTLSSGQRIHLIGQNMYFYLGRALTPGESALFHQAESLQAQNLDTDMNLLPFVLFIPFFILALIRIREKWSRAIILGLIAYLCLITPSLSQAGAFLDGTQANEDHGLYIALPAILAFILSGSAGIARRIESGARPLWLLAVSLLLLFEISLTTSYTYAISKPTKMWELMMDQWPGSWIPKAAYIESVRAADPEGLRKQELIDLLDNILQKQPELMEMRMLLARSYRDARQENNAIREYKRILREFEPDNAFLKEAIEFYERMGMRWEADNARKRLTTEDPTSPSPTTTTEP